MEYQAQLDRETAKVKSQADVSCVEACVQLPFPVEGEMILSDLQYGF